MDSVIRGNSITREAHYHLDGVLTDPTLPRVTIRDPLGVAQVTDAVPTRIATGIYQYTYAVDLAALTGIWQAEWQGTVSSQAIGPIPDLFEVKPIGAIAPVASSTYTYDLSSDVGKVRLLIQDHDMSSVSLALPMERRSAAFTDEEIAFFISVKADVLQAAAMALRAWANSKQLIVIGRRTGRTEVDFGTIRADLLKAAENYDKAAIEAPADGVAEQTWTDFGMRQVLTNNYLRQLT